MRKIAKDLEVCGPFPNPLMVQMGEGRILFSKFWDHDDKDGGVVIEDTGEPHEIGSKSNDPADENHMPQPGEIYLRFGRKESAMALRDVLSEVIDEWPAAQ